MAQLNRSCTDLPGALVTRLMAWIGHSDFEVRHIPGERHTAAHSLSQKLFIDQDPAEAAKELDIDDFILAELNSL